MIWALVAAAIAAILVVLTTQIAWQRTKELGDAQAQLLKLKEEALQADLREKDLKIAEANQNAGEANEHAGKFEEEAGKLTAENLRLQTAIEPRRLSERQQQALAELAAFGGRTVGIKSYSSDTEGLVLASQIMNVLRRSKIQIEDNRLTMQPAGSVMFGVSVDGQDEPLVTELRKILSMDGNLTSAGSFVSTGRQGVSMSVGFGVIAGPPPAATITVSVKPIK
jgi:hypothetical protein